MHLVRETGQARHFVNLLLSWRVVDVEIVAQDTQLVVGDARSSAFRLLLHSVWIILAWRQTGGAKTTGILLWCESNTGCG